MTFGVGALGGSHPRRAAGVVGHFAPQLLIAMILLAVLIGVHPIGDPTSPAVLALPVLVMFMVLGTWALMRQHDRRLCEHCIASMPLNPSESAARYGRRFWTAHAGSNPRIMLPYLVILLGSNFLVPLYPTPLARGVWAAIQLSMIYLIKSYATHRRLQPWCPQCQGGDGRSEDDEVIPDPDPSDHRQLV